MSLNFFKYSTLLISVLFYSNNCYSILCNTSNFSAQLKALMKKNKGTPSGHSSLTGHIANRRKLISNNETKGLEPPEDLQRLLYHNLKERSAHYLKAGNFKGAQEDLQESAKILEKLGTKKITPSAFKNSAKASKDQRELFAIYARLGDSSEVLQRIDNSALSDALKHLSNISNEIAQSLKRKPSYADLSLLMEKYNLNETMIALTQKAHSLSQNTPTNIKDLLSEKAQLESRIENLVTRLNQSQNIRK